MTFATSHFEHAKCDYNDIARVVAVDNDYNALDMASASACEAPKRRLRVRHHRYFQGRPQVVECGAIAPKEL